ncbi:MAG: Rpn family recombination-promoting nuclease/putative transposase [Lachnospiraceae bacterium]|nr:Rpn family recombination-promoting nuclease/putative transposase [Lachnospiraceae bacterium]
MKLASLKYDDVFREVFAREGVRRQLISDVTGILDIAVILTDGIRVDIELQLRPQKYWLKRNLFYLAKMYTGDLRAGQRYDCLNRCIAISILDFDLVPGEECHTAYTLQDKRGQELTDLFEVHIIELRKQICPGEAVGDWIRLINAENTEELEMIVTGNAGILEAMEVMRTMSLGKRLRMRYEAHLKAVRDRWAEDEYVRDQGIEEGLVRGKAEGKADTVLLLLSEKGTVSGELEEMIRGERDPERLDSLVKAAARAESVEAFRKTSVL